MARRWWGLALGLLLVLAGAGAVSADTEPRHRFSTDATVVAVGDIHGDIDAFRELATELGLLDEAGAWTGGRTHLVVTGDMLDRGDYGKDVLRLLMRLQSEASAAGGAVHVLLGNHEVMVLSGDLRYVSEGDFARHGGRSAFHERFSPAGELGRWLLERPTMVVVNDTAFVHGGLSSWVAGKSLERINREARADLHRFVFGRHALIAAGRLDADAGFDRIREAATRAASDQDAEFRRIGREMMAALDGAPYHPDGPLWYRGSSLCHPMSETEILDRALAGVGARRLAVGHTVTHDRRISSRFGGRLLRLDTGMNHSAYGGRPSALLIDGDAISAHRLGVGRSEPVVEPARVWNRPYGMSDEEIEHFLRNAEIVERRDIGTGVTRPQRFTLELDGQRMRAAFGTEDTDPGLQRSRWRRTFDHADRYVYNYVAYRLDRLLGLEMVPVTVLRTVDGVEGSLSYWLEGTLNENERRERGLSYGGHCDMPAQYNIMNVFDLLVFNVDRNLGNILYDERTWMLWMIDHSRAFGTQQGTPRMLRNQQTHISPQMREALERLDRDALRELQPYLHSRQVRALEQRARWLARQGR